MCHDGAMPEDSSCATRPLKVSLRAMISWFVCNNFNVALINELRCSDSKAITLVLESSCQQGVKDFGTFCDSTGSESPTRWLTLESVKGIVEPSERDAVSILVLNAAIREGIMLGEEASTFLLHTAALQYLPLANRRPLDMKKKRY
ncbi:hypothetical protein DM02DRAFT_620764 [Periconia macrospinosa]|uniref:Uncharacterized protein n=1 Tax=Periconia macrospinosa TaxID=97972 RepID=A0A2V1D0G4_9PLEO|nr:hypothetical protein DM02DRAFT_620764 [Periconia macrospinosa]